MILKLFQKHNKKSKGFTLIELMVVISIISLISSILFADLSGAKVKANNAKKLEEAHSVQNALQAYYNDNKTMPGNYLSNGGGTLSPAPQGDGTAIAIEDPQHPGSLSDAAYNQSMGQLVAGGYLNAIPHSPDPDSPYGYFDYNPGGSDGASLITSVSPLILAMSPSSAYTTNPVLPQVTLTGLGFTPTGNIINFNNSPISTVNSDGHTLIFTAPTYMCPPLTPGSIIKCFSQGNYPVTVTNANGISNSATFVILPFLPIHPLFPIDSF